MGVFRFRVLFVLVVGAPLLFLVSLPDSTPKTSSVSGRDAALATTTKGRKLKENFRGYNPGTSRKTNERELSLEDYSPIDPAPASKASVRPGPIEHNAPLIPYIPRLPPPPPPLLPPRGRPKANGR